MLFKGIYIFEDITYYVCINMYGVSLKVTNITNEQMEFEAQDEKSRFSHR